MKAKKSKINFKDYEAVDALEPEEQALFNQLQEGQYQSVMTDELKAKYVDIFTENSKREHASTVRLTMNDKILAKMKAKEENYNKIILVQNEKYGVLEGYSKKLEFQLKKEKVKNKFKSILGGGALIALTFLLLTK
jgi:hypothetical protein